MTHTLHRIKDQDASDNDYVILAMPAQGYNTDAQAPEKLSNFLKLFAKHNPVNMGGMGIGHLYESTLEQMIDKIYPGLPMVHGVFNTREDLIAALRDIKDADMGISVVVSGLADDADCCAREVGVKRHSINFSLGVWGNIRRLPDERYCKITSMCGHAMISLNLIKKMIADIKASRITIDEAAAELARPCVCGIFNGERAKQILIELM